MLTGYALWLAPRCSARSSAFRCRRLWFKRRYRTQNSRLLKVFACLLMLKAHYYRRKQFAHNSVPAALALSWEASTTGGIFSKSSGWRKLGKRVKLVSKILLKFNGNSMRNCRLPNSTLCSTFLLDFSAHCSLLWRCFVVEGEHIYNTLLLFYTPLISAQAHPIATKTLIQRSGEENVRGTTQFYKVYWKRITKELRISK